MIRTRRLLEHVTSRLARRLAILGRRRSWATWPERWNVALGALLLGIMVWTAFATRVPDPGQLPAEVVFCFLGLYFYSAGFLSGSRTGQVSSGGWAGAACGLTFGGVVCAAMYVAAITYGVREAVRSGSLDQVAIAVSGLVFFTVMGAICGALGARGAVNAQRPPSSRMGGDSDGEVVPPVVFRRRW